MHHHDWDSDSDFLDDWMQINWEILEEGELLGVNQSLSQVSGHPHRRSILKPDIDEPDYVVIAQLDFGEIDLNTDKIIPQDSLLRLYGFLWKKSANKFEHGFPFDLACLIDDSKDATYIVPFSEIRCLLYPAEMVDDMESLSISKDKKITRVESLWLPIDF